MEHWFFCVGASGINHDCFKIVMPQEWVSFANGHCVLLHILVYGGGSAISSPTLAAAQHPVLSRMTLGLSPTNGRGVSLQWRLSLAWCKPRINPVYVQPHCTCPSTTIWWHKSGSTLAQVIACCLTAPNLNQCWCFISRVQQHSCEGKFHNCDPSQQWLTHTWNLLQ